MKKAKRLLRALGQVDERLAEEAVSVPKKRPVLGWCIGAASVAVMALVVIGAWQGGWLREEPSDIVAEPDPFVNKEETSAVPDREEKEDPPAVSEQPEADPESGGETEVIVPWADLSLPQQYPEAEYQGERYSSQNAALAAEDRGEFLGDTILRAENEETGESFTQNAALYAIRGISADCAIAVEFEGTEGYFVYNNSYYRPETLGDFIADLNLKEHLSFGTAYSSDGSYWMGFDQIGETVIWEMMLQDMAMENVYDQSDPMLMMQVDAFSISIDVPILGYKNISLGLTKEGYVTTNILNTGKMFFIGEEKAAEILDYVQEHCTKTPIETDPSQTDIPE